MTDNYTPGIQNPNNYPVEKPLYDSGEASAPTLKTFSLIIILVKLLS